MKTFPICAKCRVSYVPLKNGVYVLELAGERPYKLWNADSWKCPRCGHMAIGGFGSRAREHFDAHFAEEAIRAYEAGLLYLEIETVPVTMAEVLPKLYERVAHES